MNRRNFVKISLLTAFALTTDLSALTNTKYLLPKEYNNSFLSLYEFVKYKPYNAEQVKSLLDYVEGIKGYQFYKDKDMISMYKYLYINNDSRIISKRILNTLNNPNYFIDEDPRIISNEKSMKEKHEKALAAFAKVKEKKLNDLKEKNTKILQNYDAKEKIPDKLERANLEEKLMKIEESLIKSLDKQEKELLKRIEKDNEVISANKNKKLKDLEDKYKSNLEKNNNFENVLFYYKSGEKDKARELYSLLTEDNARAYPSDLKELSYMLKYLIYTGQQDKAIDVFSTVEKNRLDRNIISLLKSKKPGAIDSVDPHLFEVYICGAYLFRSETKKHELYKDYVETLTNGDKNYMFYSFYKFEDVNENYSEASDYLDYVSKNDNFNGINELIFDIENKAAQKEFKSNRWAFAWLHAKKGIESGYNLDYNTYYSSVVYLKKILKASSEKYIEELNQKNRRDMIIKVYNETNITLNLRQK